MNHKIPDKVPWSGMVNKYFLSSQDKKFSNMGTIEFLNHIGADLMAWNKFSTKCKNMEIKTYINDKLYISENGHWFSDDYLLDNNFRSKDKEKIIIKEYITNRGKLNARFIYKEKSATVFIDEFPIKKVQDYKIISEIIENIEYEDLSKSYEEKYVEIGEKGLCISFLHSTPVYEMICLLIGLERFYYFFHDYKNETLRLINIMSEKFCEAYKLYSSYKSVDAVVIPEDASTTLYSPLFFKDYIRPFLIKYCKIIKESNKIAIIHACGHLKGLLEHFKNIDFDCLESVSQPPTGNVYISDVKKFLSGICIMGGIPANVFLDGPEDFKKYVTKLILDNKDSGNFILSSADSVPAFAKIRNLKSISALISKFGKY